MSPAGHHNIAFAIETKHTGKQKELRSKHHCYQYFVNQLMMERSVGMILIIPFGICFILLFLVCCFADEMKKMCILPSQIPPSYRSSSPVFNTDRQNESYSALSTLQNNRLNPDNIENHSLIVEQAETEQLITDDLILTQVDFPVQINISANTRPNHEYSTMINNNNHNNCHQNTTNIINDDDDDDENHVVYNIQKEYHHCPQHISRDSIFLENNICVAVNSSSRNSSSVLSHDTSGIDIEEAK